jgi:rubrerythrin
MKEDLISFKTAKLAKEKGFDWGCQDCYSDRGYLYSNGWCERLDDWFEDQDFFNSEIEEKQASEKYYTRPTQSLLQKWLREEHKINVEVTWMCEKWFCDVYDLKTPMPNKSMCKSLFNEKEGFKTYEEALEKGLLEGLKSIK